MTIYDYSTEKTKSQELLNKLSAKRKQATEVSHILENIGYNKIAEHIHKCGTYVGITEIENIAHIVKADFCRERVCPICAWRRQAKFLSQTIPIIQYLSSLGYNFIFATLTIKNVKGNNLGKAIDIITKGYNLLSKRRQVKRAWSGIIRSIEVTYNHKKDTFHPHIHMLIAVTSDYYTSADYISHSTLINLWKECIQADYNPSVHIQAVTGESEEVGAVETIKYALKPTQEVKALKCFIEELKGRRLISFSGIFGKIRKELKYSSIDDVCIDDLPTTKHNINYNLYKFDVSGGFYKFINKYQMEV